MNADIFQKMSVQARIQKKIAPPPSDSVGTGQFSDARFYHCLSCVIMAAGVVALASGMAKESVAKMHRTQSSTGLSSKSRSHIDIKSN